MPSLYKIIGLMSGTSLDGIDAALIETDGAQHIKRLDFLHQPYDNDLRDKLRACLGRQDIEATDIKGATEEMTRVHANIVNDIKQRFTGTIDGIGFHGQTLYHAPEDGITIQVGDAHLLAQETGLNVISDFRSEDVRCGGEGAPLIPLYHRAIALNAGLELPVTFLNIGGVSNITHINGNDISELSACDTGPGNALIDDIMLKRRGKKYDTDGIVASSGKVQQDYLQKWLTDPYFAKPAPKSLDRDHWQMAAQDMQNATISTDDAVASLSTFTIESIAQHITRTKGVYVCGGGRHNSYIMNGLKTRLGCAVEPIESLNYDGDSIEAEGFAYLAARHLNGKATSLPNTTGTQMPICGGVLTIAE